MGRGIKGAGDAVAAITKAIGIQSCEACEERRQKWNTMFPVKLKKNIRELTEEEVNEWKSFKETATLRLSIKEAEYVSEIYASVFNVPVYKPCPACSAKPLIVMIERMDKIVETYV